MIKIPDGMMRPTRNNVFGFTPSRFEGWLWKKGNDIYVSMIESIHEQQGDFCRLANKILEMGYNVKIPTPLGRMIQIVKKVKYKKTIEDDPSMGPVEVWVKKARAVSKRKIC